MARARFRGFPRNFSRRRAPLAAAVPLWVNDPGHEALTWEIWMPGRELLRRPVAGGQLQVTAHHASSKQGPQEWRVLRFIPEKTSSNLIQAINKVRLADATHGQPDSHMRNCLLMPYTKSMVSAVLAALAMGPDKDQPRILCVGLGGGSMPAFLAEMLPNCHVDVVELEPAVLEAAVAMGFEPSDRVEVFLEEGAGFARRRAERSEGYDAVLIDAYDVEGNVPDAFRTGDPGIVEALSAGLLKLHGVLAINFLPGTALRPLLAAHREALSRHGTCVSFAIQAEGSGNLIALQILGLPMRSSSKAELQLRLWLAAQTAQAAGDCPFSLSRLATRGLCEVRVQRKKNDNDLSHSQRSLSHFIAAAMLREITLVGLTTAFATPEPEAEILVPLLAIPIPVSGDEQYRTGPPNVFFRRIRGNALRMRCGWVVLRI
ncbi:unnamed protein product [Effrenium voratum]|uniref:Methyltransferase domain-containing protein n=2 Tax=Effrenium voratum TaxID=2562239 RepID=A0AA36NJC9_9DINO|nr:unnamed protein product [Effrenium voratum]